MHKKFYSDCDVMIVSQNSRGKPNERDFAGMNLRGVWDIFFSQRPSFFLVGGAKALVTRMSLAVSKQKR